MSKTRRTSGPTAHAMRELVARLRLSLLSLLRAETNADGKLIIRQLDESLRHWAAMHLPHRERVLNDGEPASDQPPTVEATSVEEKPCCGKTTKVD